MASTGVRLSCIRIIGLAFVAATVAACGTPPPEMPVERWVLTSVAECTTMTATPEAKCVALIEAAIVEHTTQGLSYQTSKLCEKAEGVDMCERLEEKVWRPKPQAYLVTRVGGAMTANILYAGKDKAIVFRSADTTTFDPDKGDKTEYSPTSLRRVAAFGQS